ncbi:MAG: galactose mutarotase [Clostridiales bacterium]|nr:galactose mutarotase [Clostridiales bacterium]
MIKAYTLKNKHNIEVTILNLGGIIHEIKVPDREGNFENIIHGFEHIEDYINNDAFFGAIIGRTAGRIKEGIYTLNNKHYQMPAIDRGNGLHGGSNGFDKKIWDVKECPGSLILTYVSPDGEEGFPGTVEMTVRYTLTDKDELIIDYKGISDQDTLLNLTNHSYFNLNPKETILEMELMVNSDQLLEIDELSIPTGNLLDVKETPFDFRIPKKIGRDIFLEDQQLKNGGGYDHPWLVNGDVKLKLSDETTGRQLMISSDQPCVVLYSYNFPLEGHKKHQGLAIEFQKEPDSLNHPHFTTCILKKDEVYAQKTVYKFKVE